MYFNSVLLNLGLPGTYNYFLDLSTECFFMLKISQTNKRLLKVSYRSFTYIEYVFLPTGCMTYG